MSRHHCDDKAGKSCAAERSISRGWIAEFSSVSYLSVLLAITIIMLSGLMAGSSHAQDVAFNSKRIYSRPVILAWNTEPGSAGDTITGEGDDYVDFKEIHYGPPDCTYHDPELSISPSDAQWSTPGTPVEYTVIVTNTSSTSCDITNFDLSASAPPGWEASLDSETLEIAPDWSMGIVTMVVTSPASAASGSHDITITAGNELLSIDSSATATYVVDTDTRMAASMEDIVATPDTDGIEAAPADLYDAGTAASEGTGNAGTETCIRSAPNLSLSPTPPDSVRPTRPGFRYSVSLTNNDGPACAVSSFDLTLVFLTTGWKGSLSARQLSLAPGESGSATLALTSSSAVPAGRYTLQLGVSDVSSPEHARTSLDSQVYDAARAPAEAEHD